MSSYTSVLDNVRAARDAIQAPVTSADNERGYAELALKLFQGPGAPSTIAFVAVTSGAGVTRTVQRLAAELLRSQKSVAAVKAASETPRSIVDLRANSDCVLIDCKPLDTSADLLRFAAVADGVVLVVEAGRTTKDELERAGRLIQEARGKLLGCVLNKRRYPIPNWLYRLL
jgi:Mrp family chromosome partitioning ATPase